MSKRGVVEEGVGPKRLRSEYCLSHFTILSNSLKADGHPLDDIVVHLEPNLLLVLLNFGEILDEVDLASLASANWTWFTMFNGEANLWNELTTCRAGVNRKGKNYGAKFDFVYPHFEQVYGQESFPAALVFRLNQDALMRCEDCGMESNVQGKKNIPLSCYQLQYGEYQCINPDCAILLSRKLCGYKLKDVFTACSQSVESKNHEWISMDHEFLHPLNEEAIVESFHYCERCGLLLRDGDSDNEEYCDECLETECICVPCKFCKQLPASCKCEECDTCHWCSAPECKKCEEKCACEYCDDCGMPTDNCECESSYEF